MKHQAVLQNGYDSSVVRRVAAVLLRHVRPQSRTEAFMLLDSKLAMYLFDRTGLAVEVDHYFGDQQNLAA
jgi:hypothetical protein